VPEGAPEKSALHRLLAQELAGAVPDGVAALCEAVRRRHGDAVAAVLFYGSCLRRGNAEGVVDFYVLVDRYRPVHRSALAAALARLLPPNVFYLEHAQAGKTLRTKYAVVSTRDFARLAAGRSLDCRVWARFCQPARLVYARDAAAAEAAVAAVDAATCTALGWMLAWLPGEGAERRVPPEALFVGGFRETYRAELRGEQQASIDALYASQSVRFGAVLQAGLEALEAAGVLEILEPLQTGRPTRVRAAGQRLQRRRRQWPFRRRLSKSLAMLGQLKTPLTFEGWAPYALWKLERHSGVHIELSPRQRRHPLVYGWPVILRILRDGLLR